MGDIKPIRRVFEDALSVVFEYREEFLRPKYTIACLIYKSVDWLKFVYDQILKYTDLSDKEFYFIANDANHEVLGYLTKNRIPHHVFNNTSQHSEEWYINNVYRAYNYAVKMAKGDFIVLINSDMAFSPDWFESLVSSYNGNNCVASRLVESGKFPSGQYGVEKNFGRQVSQYQEGDFIDFCKLVSESKSLVGGLFMPLFFKKEHFLAVGGYPEGNIKIGSDIFHPIIAKKEDEQISGDLVLIKKLETIGVSRVTSFGSLVYHFQCGELDELTNNERFTNLNVKNIAICNDIAGGSMGEKVFWNFLLDEFEDTYAIDYGTVHSCDGDFSIKANEYIKNKFHDTKVILQNATFIDFVSKDYFTIVFLQDDLRSMNRKSFQQEYNLKSADLIVANSMKIAASYRDFDCEVISIGIDEKLFDIKDKMFCRNKHSFDLTKKIGIFVGNFSEVKGWLEVKSCIQSRPDIFWILVTKNNENFIADNVVVYSRIKQELLVELLNCANFFIIGSLIETQCLAALEACLCGVPVVMHNTGIFSSFTDDDRDRLGYFGDNLLAGIDTVLSKNYNTREVIISKELTKATTLKRWDGLLSACVTIHNARSIRGGYDIERDVKSKHSLFYRKFLYYLEVYIYPNKEFNLKKILITHLKKIGIYNFIRKIYLFFRD